MPADRQPPSSADGEPVVGRAGSVLRAFLVLGLTSFGGPVAHLGFFRTEFVDRRGWLTDAEFADLIALCTMLPGPTSSQVGLAIGLRQAGLVGALAAWIGFTLPSAILLTLFGLGLSSLPGSGRGWLHGLEAAAAAIVAVALTSMFRTLAPDRLRASLAVAGCCAALVLPPVLGQITVILLGAVAGMIAFRGVAVAPVPRSAARVSRAWGAVALGLFLGLLATLPLAAGASDNILLARADSFYRAGALVFGGGHVVLPLLQAEVVPRGWISPEAFLAGYGAAQAVPGPLFTFAAFLGAAMQPGRTAGSARPSRWRRSSYRRSC